MNRCNALPFLFQALLGVFGALFSGISLAGPETPTPTPQLSPENLAEIRKSAEAGDAPAQGYLGAWYAFGETGPHDFGEAIKWVRKSAMQGNALAQTCLGEFYALGQGVQRDNAEAVKWFK